MCVCCRPAIRAVERCSLFDRACFLLLLCVFFVASSATVAVAVAVAVAVPAASAEFPSRARCCRHFPPHPARCVSAKACESQLVSLTGWNEGIELKSGEKLVYSFAFKVRCVSLSQQLTFPPALACSRRPLARLSNSPSIRKRRLPNRLLLLRLLPLSRSDQASGSNISSGVSRLDRVLSSPPRSGRSLDHKRTQSQANNLRRICVLRTLSPL